MALDAQLMDRVFSSPQLPSLPAIALKIIELVQEDEADLEKIAETISQDPALSTKLLKTVNSSFYGLPKTVGSVHQAVMVLGLNSVKTLALGFSLVGNLTGTGGAGFDHMAFWRRSLYCATAAKQFCERLHLVQAEELFMSSLLQDVGVLALAQVLDGQYAKLMKQTGGDHTKLSALEREAFGADHAEVGAALAESWGLPPLLVESIRMHERADESPGNLKPLIRTVQAGALAGALIERPDDEESVGEFHRVTQAWFGLDPDEAQSLLKKVFEHAGEVQRLFELPTGDLADPEVILGKARKALDKLNQQGGDDAPAAPTPKPAPAPAASAAPAHEPTVLTGVASRRQFDEHLDEQFLEADTDRPLSLVFVDLDKLKRINDAHGWSVGDAVLRTVGEALRIGTEDNGTVYHFGDDDFVVLCPATARSDAALLAELLRHTVELLQCEVGVEPDKEVVQITASVGVVTYEGTHFKRPEQLVKAASKGVFAAKDVGSNRVRVFVPRSKAA